MIGGAIIVVTLALAADAVLAAAARRLRERTQPDANDTPTKEER